MAHKVIDRCKETTSSTGTGNLTLTGAVSGFVSMANAATGLTSNGDTGWFCAEAGAQWEVFLGTRISATELAGTPVLSSSTGSTVNFSTPPVVFSTVPAAKLSAVGPAFSAYRATSTQAITTSTSTKVAFNATDFDTAACFDPTTNNRFTPNVAGYYRFEWLINITAASVTSAVAFLRKNGTDVASGTSVPTATTPQIQTGGSKLVYMNGSSDYVELFVYAIGTSLTVAAGIDKAFLTGSFVRGT